MRTRIVSAMAVALCSTLVTACSEEPAPVSSQDPLDDAPASTPGDLESAPVAPAAAPSSPGIGDAVRSSHGAAEPVPEPEPAPDPVPDPAPDPVPDPVPADPNAGAGPQPTVDCAVVRNGAGFFTRTSSKSAYVAYVPASYDGSAPARLIVGLHGCGDSAANFAAWGINPYDTRSSQDHIGISIGGKDGQCWSASDDDKVLAAVDDISSCFWVHQKRVVIAGYSSGGISAYRVGLSQASRFAGIIIEDSGLYGTGSAADALLAGASWRLNIAHLTHSSDTVFPLAKVQADWAKTTTAGFALTTSVIAGTHDGTSTDWADWLVPQSAAFFAP